LEKSWERFGERAPGSHSPKSTKPVTGSVTRVERLNHLAAVVLLLALLIVAPIAHGAISETHTIDGPSPDVLDIGGVAMAEDGTGGIVYRKRVDGRAHVFAAQFENGAWRTPQRVDTGQAFDSSWPRIGAGNRGRLVVTWVQEFGAGSDRMFSAALDPGATRFQPPVPVDLNVGEATATFPSLAMARGGTAYLAYRVVTDTSAANPPGYVGADVKVARYGGSLWTVLGSVIDRNPSIPVRAPTALNSPRVGIDVGGTSGIVAFQEPGDDFVDRIWARRLFGGSMGIPLQVSPSEWDGAPLRGPADAFSLDVAGFAQGAVAFRQQPGEGGRLGATRIMVNEIPDSFSEGAAAFAGARLADGEARADLGPPSVAVTPLSPFRAVFASGPGVLGASGDSELVDPVERIDEGNAAPGSDPRVDVAATSAAAMAWKATNAVTVRELRADGVPEVAVGSAPRGGPVNALELGGSGLGDAIVAFHQGGTAFGQVAAVVVDAPPSEFFIQVPEGWVRKRRVRVGWDPSPSAISPARYTVTVDDEPVVEGLRRLRTTLGPRHIDDGLHTMQVIAIDAAGQETGSQAGQVRIDRNGPRVRVSRRGRRVTVRVIERRRRDGSGLRRRSVRIAFGDGTKQARKPRARHSYRRRGVYRVVVRARDRAGNRTTFRRKLRVR
jgi:PKD domain